jgi:WD40 repeat protein
LYAFSPYYNSEIVILNIETKEKYSIPSIQNPHLTFASGTMLLAYKDNDIQVCNVVERQCETIIDNMGDVRKSQLSSGGSLLALGISDGSVNIWDKKQSKSLASFSGSWAASDLIFSSNENLLVWGDGNIIKILDIQSNNLSELKAHSDVVEKLVFSPDDQYLASSAFRDRVILWDINSQTIIGEMPVNPYWVGSMAFSSDSNKLIIPLTMAPKFGGYSSLLVWDIQNFVSRTKVCEIVGRNLTQQEWQQYFPSETYITTCPQWASGQ